MPDDGGSTFRSCGRTFSQFLSLLLSFFALALISFSLDHDRRWNHWVDQQFNLNRKNSIHLVHLADYVEITSQQDWIDLVSRDSIFDKGFLVLSAFVAVIMTFYVLTCNNSRNSNILGGMVYLTSCLCLLLGGCLLTASVLLVETSELEVDGLVVKLSSKTGFENETIFSRNETIQLLQKEIYCNSVDHQTSILRHCQAYVIKLVAIVDSFVNAAACMYLFSTFFFKEGGQVVPLTNVDEEGVPVSEGALPTREESVHATRSRQQLQKTQMPRSMGRRPDPEDPMKTFREEMLSKPRYGKITWIDQNGHINNITGIGYGYDVFGLGSGKSSNQRPKKQVKAYQPHIRGKYDDDDNDDDSDSSDE